jgi:hypothetical protein
MFKKAKRLKKKLPLNKNKNITISPELNRLYLRSPFSVNLTGVDNANFSSKNEQVQQHRNLLLCVEEHCQTPFGGPIKDPVAWVHLQRYLNFRGMGVEETSPELTPSVGQLINSGRKALVRCQTPPPAKDLFIGFFENDQYGWSSRKPSSPRACEHREFMDLYCSGDYTMQQCTEHDLHKGLSEMQNNTLCKTDYPFNFSQLKDGNFNESRLNNFVQVEELVSNKPVQKPCLTPLQSVLDNPSKVERGFVKPVLLHRFHGKVQSSRYTKEMANYGT